MTMTQSVSAKVFAAFVALAMAFSLAAPAQAQSVSDMSLEELVAMVNQLQAQLEEPTSGGAMSASGVCPYTWTRTLNMGSTGSDVMMLQKFLNSMPETMVAATGAGSAGMETEYYGPATGAAVANFQMKYRADILSPLGLINPTTFFGNASMAQANKLCVAAPTMPDMDEDDGMMDDEDEDMDDEDVELGGSATLDTVEIDDAGDTEIEEGNEDAEIGEITVEFDNGDAEISRIDLALLGQNADNTNTIEPWEAFESISLWVDGDKIAEVAADDEDEYLDEDLGVLRFNNLGLIAMEDEEIEIVVAATVQNNLDSDELTDWELYITEMRFFDADGVATTETTFDDITPEGNLDNDASPSAEFEIREEGDEDELTVRTANSDPDATTLELEDDETSDFMTIFAFDLDSEDSVNDIEVTQLRVDVSATENGTDATSTVFLINDARLVVDGEEYDDVNITNDTTGNYIFDLDDEDFFIDAGDRVTVEFQVEFEALLPRFEGATVQATVDTDGLTAEGADDLTVGNNQLSGSATGDEHTLRTEGAILEFVSSTETKDLNSDTTANDDEGVFVLKFDVTAFENDLFVNKTAASGTAMGTNGVNFQITDGSGTLKGTTTVEASLSSTAKTEGTRFKVNEGETETFTLTVNYDPGTGGFYGVRIYSLNFNVANSNPNTQQRALPEEDYESDPLSI